MSSVRPGFRAWCRTALRAHAPRLFLVLWRTATTAEIGLVGEDLVARALHRDGARIEARRLRTPWGELDLLAHDARGLVAIEVKSARIPPRPRIRGQAAIPLAERDRPGARVDAQGRARLERIARGVAAQRGLPARAEVFEVLVGPGRFELELGRVPRPRPILHEKLRQGFMAGERVDDQNDATGR